MGKNVETGEQAWASMNPIAEKFQDKIVSVHEATGRPVLGVQMLTVSYTHLTLPTSDLV